MVNLSKPSRGWGYCSERGGLFVTIYAPDGRTAFLQGDEAGAFLERIDQTNERYTDADVCAEYDSVCE